ncbi:hypothetical protein PPL_08371 [Heterostelium album PN500]|uniref:Uncharacterized protein n=1 Tax=Heterostelium pallidum (strain ATCC 26659 / Pp 5 / PN500) TaxID=670386 RepID=D3BI03_HETP5|nr:hypothetical protein PPL_08371 [Heterostelium album PN500]EFA78903.1 hypothetical protein PPL_08371 [Heterostelium album PN500]|eukprot:XP_020431027.1 hypothetical protein PPL_08371 [Heterostelium album PN500]
MGWHLFSLEHDVVPRISNDQLPPEAKAISSQIATIALNNNNNNNNNTSQSYQNSNINNGNGIVTTTHFGSQTRAPSYLRDKLDHFKLGSSFNGLYTVNNNNNSNSNNNNNSGNNSGNSSGNSSRYNTPPPHFIANQLQQHQQQQQQQQQQSSSGLRVSSNNSSPLNSSINGDDDYDEDSDFVPLDSDSDMSTMRSAASSFDPNAMFSGYGHASTSLDSSNLLQYYPQKCIAQIIDLRIIGKDNTGTFLIARDAISDGMQKTFVDKIDIYSSDKRPETLLKFCGTIISACLSNEPTKSLLFFTVKQPDKVVDVNTKNEDDVTVSVDLSLFTCRYE